MVHQDSSGFLGIANDFFGFLFGFLRIPQDSFEFFRIPWDSLGCLRIL